MKTSLWILIVGVIIGIISLTFSDFFWVMIGIENIEIRKGLSMTSSLFFLILSFSISLFYTLDEYSKKNSELIQKIKNERSNDFVLFKKELISKIPTLDIINSYTSKQALLEISPKLKNAKSILNTKFLHPNFSDDFKLYKGNLKSFPESLMNAVIGGAILRDVVSNTATKYCIELEKNINKNKNDNFDGYYDARLIEPAINTMINFIVIDYVDGKSEVWFGWVISPGKELEQVTFRSSEKELVDMFKSWHQDLFKSGKIFIKKSS